MSIPLTEIAFVIRMVKEGAEWLQEQKKLGNISEDDFNEIFERIEIKKTRWDDLSPDKE